MSPVAESGLSENDVHLWVISLRQPGEVVGRLGAVLAEGEKARADRFHSASDREKFLVGRGAMRTVLGAYLGEPPARIAFERGEFGKPRLADSHGRSGLQFNLSHAGDLAVLAVAWERRVGVDIEPIRPMSDRDRIVARFFSPRERAAFSSLAEDHKSVAFFRIWTRKEAYLKALGTGLSTPLDGFDVPTSPESQDEITPLPGFPHDGSPWTMMDLPTEPGYLGALVVEGAGWRLTRYRFET